MQKKIRRFTTVAAATLLAGSAVIGFSGVANAAIVSSCSQGVCQVYEDMGSGYCDALIDQTDANENYSLYGNFAGGFYENQNAGYTCDFWMERNVNSTGWYQVGSTTAIAPSGVVQTPNIWNGSGYQARICFRFNWGSSLGAAHCSPPVSIGV
jgi:hypothetical protein